MSNTIEILPFGLGAGSNVTTQAAWAADPAQAAGFQSGVAPSAKLNKVWRQSSFIAAMLAKFISDKAVVDVLDDGDLAGLEAKLVTAINAVTSLLFSGNQSLASSGHVKLPGGFILQWANFVSSSTVDVVTTLDIAFPTAAYAVFVSGDYTPASGVTFLTSAHATLTQVTARSTLSGNGTYLFVLGK